MAEDQRADGGQDPQTEDEVTTGPAIDATEEELPPERFRTICEVHRQIFQELRRRNQLDPLLELLREAYTMAKKMNNKLRQYKHNYDDGWWEEHRLDGEDLETPSQE